MVEIMSAVERLEASEAPNPKFPQPEPVLPEPSLVDAVVDVPTPSRARLRPLMALCRLRAARAPTQRLAIRL